MLTIRTARERIRAGAGNDKSNAETLPASE